MADNIKEIYFDGAYVNCSGEDVTFGFSSIPEKNRCRMLYEIEKKKGKTSFETTQKPHFKKIGPMLDVSRGGVMNVDGVKKMIDKVSTLGMNMLMLYTEAHFEMEKYPLFGYMIGKYKISELWEIDRYGDEHGVEIIPCVQTLGHLEKYMKYGEVPSENSRVLLCGDERTYEFIEEIVKTMSIAFKSRNIHIGMDEAEGLGMGNYFKKHGLCDKGEILNKHLRRVIDITKKYGYEPMMWSDMYYSTISGSDYYKRGYEIPESVIDGAPEDIMHVYWDYYHCDYEFYEEKLTQEARFKNKIGFAGGVWTWDGFLPNFSHTYNTMKPALECSIDRNIDFMLATLWGNDGCETDYHLALSGLAIFSEYCYRGKECTKDEIFEVSKYICGEGEELTYAISDFWMGESGAERVGKGIIYSDLLIDTYCRTTDFDAVLKTYGKALEIIEKHKDIEGYSYYKAVFEAAFVKAEIMGKLRHSYKSGDTETIKIISSSLIPDLRIKLRKMYEEFKKRWFMHYKAVGFERFPARFGGMDLRLEYVNETLCKYLNGEIMQIEELEEEVNHTLKQTWKDAAGYMGYN